MDVARETGSNFVHQSACFWLGPQRGCFNLLYQRMATGKWYPLVAELEFLLKRAGFEITTVVPGPPLLLDSASLAERYHLTPEQVLAIRDELEREFGTERNVFRPEPEGFKSWLHYHIFTCRAI